MSNLLASILVKIILATEGGNRSQRRKIISKPDLKACSQVVRDSGNTNLKATNLLASKDMLEK